MTAQDMPEAVAESKISRIERARALGAAQADIEDGGHLGPHPDNVDREAKAEAEARDRLRSIVERTERLQEEATALRADIADIMKEAKARGYSVKAIRAVLKLRAMEPADANELDELVDLYRRQLGC